MANTNPATALANASSNHGCAPLAATTRPSRHTRRSAMTRTWRCEVVRPRQPFQPSSGPHFVRGNADFETDETGEQALGEPQIRAVDRLDPAPAVPARGAV